MQIEYKEEDFYNKGGRAVALFAQRGGGAPSLRYPRLGNGALSTDGAVGVPVHCRGAGLNDLSRSLPTQMIL